VEKSPYLQPLHAAIIEHGVDQLDLFPKGERKIAAIAAQFLADERVDPIYAHPGLCLTVLPHREIAPGQVWQRNTGYASLVVHPLQGHDGRQRGVPFGPKARLILLYLMTEAVKTRCREVELGRSMSAWLRAMGVSVGGNNYRTVADQADRIEHSILRFSLTCQHGELTLQDSIIRGAFRPFADGGCEHTVQLSEGFFDAIVRHPVPIVEAALRLLADTCMPLDLYLWLAYRLHALDKTVHVPWHSLHVQFGANTKQLKHFKPRFARDLELARAVYPESRVEITVDGVRLHPSPPPIAPRPRTVAKLQSHAAIEKS
jgi:hypothetical protein